MTTYQMTCTNNSGALMTIKHTDFNVIKNYIVLHDVKQKDVIDYKEIEVEDD